MRISDWCSDVCSSDLGDVAPQRPSAEIFKVGIQAIGEVAMMVGCTPVTTHLSETGETRLGRVAIPIPPVHVPEKRTSRSSTQCMGTRTDKTHFPAQHIPALWQRIHTCAATEWAHPGDPGIIPGGRPIPIVVPLFP